MLQCGIWQPGQNKGTHANMLAPSTYTADSIRTRAASTPLTEPNVDRERIRGRICSSHYGVCSSHYALSIVSVLSNTSVPFRSTEPIVDPAQSRQHRTAVRSPSAQLQPQQCSRNRKIRSRAPWRTKPFRFTPTFPGRRGSRGMVVGPSQFFGPLEPSRAGLDMDSPAHRMPTGSGIQGRHRAVGPDDHGAPQVMPPGASDSNQRHFLSHLDMSCSNFSLSVICRVACHTLY
ncbi:hypothetical protein BS47DRAFT_189427 [Hydnum rufescens UP504]|uniref:Uncharacterized protein n=1 Tax=Hydnum rufescens UP504 TaxID=1448309 RepID=A0A9P6DSS0_9AGAM|nr:hypothetical protein BS47DRAFT_189427 [Hydnum rufescens UP504]